MSDEDVYWGTRLACLEMIRTGTTCFWDMYWHAEATARAVEDAGVRAVTAAPLIDDSDPAKSERACSDAGAQHSTRSSRRPARWRGRGFAPHAIYTVSERSLRWVAERAAERELPVQIHLSETEDEVDGLRRRARRAARVLPRPRAGCSARTRCSRTASGSTAAELELIAERGATMVTNPVANLKLAVGGVFPYLGGARGRSRGRPRNRRRRLQQLARPALRREDVRAAAEERRARDPAAVTAARGLRDRDRAALGAARRAGARGGRAGRLPARARRCAGAGAGRRSRRGSSTRPPGTWSTRRWSAGRVLMRGGVIEGEEEVVARARERAAGLGIR